MRNIAAIFNEALAALNGRDLRKAEEGFRRVIKFEPSHVPALNLLTIVLMNTNRFAEAEPFIARAVKLNQGSDVSFYNYGLIAKQLGKPALAHEQFTRALRLNPNVRESWNNRGAVCNVLEQYEAAISDFDRAIALDPNYADAHANKGKSLLEIGRHAEALTSYDRALSVRPDLAEAWLGRGTALARSSRRDEALDAYDKALSIRADLAEAWIGRGNVLYGLRRHADAFASYDRALDIAPQAAAAWLGRGNAYADLKRYDEALAAYDKALTIKPNSIEAMIGRGNVFAGLKRRDDALALYDAALSIKPNSAEAWLGRGSVFLDLRRRDEALAAFDKALSTAPDLAEAWLGRGNVFGDVKRHAEALEAYDKALSIRSDLAEAWFGRGNIFADLRRHDEAFAAFDRALTLDRDLPGVEGARLYSKLNCCDWTEIEAETTRLIESIRAGKGGCQPFALLSIAALAEDQRRSADFWVERLLNLAGRKAVDAVPVQADKIRVGYLSADFRSHPVSYLAAGLFEAHDRTRFETHAFSIGPAEDSELRARLERSFDQFVDLHGRSDDDIVGCIKAANIDILVDLMGHTLGARLGVLAQRPAPVLAGYLGFAGTVGGALLDYVIADESSIPAEHRKHFSEKVVWLPHCFMPHDAKGREISRVGLDRREQGLPAEGFVFCGFNNAYKLNPPTFQSWMRILKEVDGSVVWLSDLQDVARSNLRREAEASGVDPQRLVFATRVASTADHLARHRLADLFLDTVPYNAHTTASDALWAGLPLLTLAGDAFAGRVAASLLHALDLPELITHSRDEYEGRAIELARDHERLRGIRETLEERRLTSPLFNTPLLTRSLEEAFEAMVRRYRAGLAPGHIEVPAAGSALFISE
ncbi:tetratricopeptide repeat protein [Bradyrhizobium liaoningense]|uniref:O-linked N-acetylglucosamine transferase family protein n=1 Tax=Bradyrhizobium liaoningense TaxID=43992 RepID=UPI001BAA061C|nr:tetratricopeptide repeat protein [Bradyrhizobium liaoningense]MBR1166932.1 tetratricopeptide repeat protein [Bradyrhizobium liaoningense]